MLEMLRDKNARALDITEESEIEYAAHCAEADIRTSPLRDCISYYNGDGAAAPGTLAYYGGPAKWHEIREKALETMEPFVLE